MRFSLLAFTLGVLGLAGCESRPAAEATSQPAAPVPVAPVGQSAAAPAALRRDTTDYMRPAGFASQRPDTLIQLGSRHYRLRITQVADSTQPIDYEPATFVTKLYAAPSDTAWYYHRVRGYEVTSTFTLRDSAGRRLVFTKALHKHDFARINSGELLTLSELETYYAGYSVGLHALVFVVYIGLPSSDVAERVALLLDARTGQEKGLYNIGSAMFEATDCDPRPSPDGQAVLTCAGQLLRAGRAPLSLKRPHAELRAARFLTDTTLLAVYGLGDYRPMRPDPARDLPADPQPPAAANVTALLAQPATEFYTTPTQSRLANAFIMSTSGRQLAAFRYDGWLAGPDYYLPRHYLPATRTYYLLNGSYGQPQSLLLLAKAHPDSVLQLPLKSLPKFRPPRRPQEAMLTINNEQQRFTFYVDTLQPRRVRYRVQAGAGG